ncbi:MAG TPA: shikimate kinase [Planctomycetaceae bacterium]|jgi:shikimate kinase|uniref:Shikimate kinase n=1 Tax=Gimesia maris TaxID=122 RepID=A0A3D3R3Z9_9PLAN|nr:shikimate kinase [Gimesia maris]MAC56233.1 shikimate kinase [Gimesia sp.]QDU12314.1 Shikimate kinase [Gimesia maris]HAW30372.1 shikimate kinase [Planctomycetaceae bacterium]HCO23306.1 shikimate kinase [Gimesia maris]|tara:strand:+ start:182838 stop:183359 length:522 start_codon:yes stop_codon:yes gene_type:complete
MAAEAAPENPGVILIGMPGSGKSTVGKLLSEQTGLPFLDTDALIEAGESKRLAEIISEHTSEGFRKIEAAYVQSIQSSGSVISTGGSVCYSREAMQHLGSLGTIVWLDVSPEVLEQRVADAFDRGVLIEPGTTLADLYDSRFPLYELYAQLKIEASLLTPEEVVSRICEQLSL